MAAKGQQGLTHDEIWDDSALVDSWNEALEEYKKYHSIHVKGGNVEDLINENNRSDTKHEGEVQPEPAQHPEEESSNDVNGTPREQGTNNVGNEDGTRDIRLSHPPAPGTAPGTAPGPAGLLGTVRDEGLKRLLMSWYYAGYYTGYYEGQREQQQQQDAESGQK